ncbi:protein IQ-DOMAIN 1 isoform X1 [Helianthus annuus]|uniref:protein IQ-DOMAIN 1 isoform X1 n=1 Tax=Helianthus annuus TaxID=4232 RepID=UPI000B90815C|nr:protein IQ-DOMAIN 1 isoform X1 [Helianthus annuus]
MGKITSGSWLTRVKRAFTPHKSFTKTLDDDLDDNNILHKREKRSRWLFGKSSRKSLTSHVQHEITQVKVNTSSHDTSHEENHAVLTKEATAKAATTTPHAALEIMRLAVKPSSVSVKHHFAATIIQTSFRGYLARRASKALRGIVMLQAVIRGQNVRKQAVVTLRCMQALLRVQSRVHDQRSRLSHDGSRRSLMYENASFCESKYVQDIRRRKSMGMSRDGNCVPDDWSDRPHNLEELDAKLHNRKFQISNRNMSTMDEKELEETASWLDQWIKAKQWENQRRDSIKTIEIDSPRPGSRSGVHKPSISNYSPSRRSNYSPSPGQQPITPSPVKTVPLQIRSASPRCMKEERSHLNANIQSLRITPRVMGSMCRYSTCANDMTVPNYMSVTESAKAKIRSQSTPRQRPSTPERERVGSVKKRLAYPVPDPCDNYNVRYCDYGQNLRSPSIKSVQVGHVGMGQQWCSGDSTTGGESSPCSTTDLRRWLR